MVSVGVALQLRLMFRVTPVRTVLQLGESYTATLLSARFSCTTLYK